MTALPDIARARRGPDLSGRRFGELEILVELARGGMGTVYIARHTGDAGFERLVAVKCILRPQTGSDDLTSEASVLDEIRLSALLRHPNIVATTAVREETECFLLVSDYVEGVSLAELLRAAEKRDTPLAPSLVACIVHDVLRGLAVAHDQADLEGEPLELVHRDLTPQNILVGVDGVARILDFGIAKAHGRAGETQEGILKGKPPYLSPEQVRGEATDRRSDLFSLGTVLYESLSGTKPFLGANDSATLMQILLCEYDSAPLVTSVAGPVVARALTLYPKERFQTAREFAGALKAAIVPGSHDEVAEWVQSTCGELLAGRKARLTAALARVPEESLPPSAMVATAQAVAEDVAVRPVRSEVASAQSTPTRALWPRALGLTALVIVAAVALFWRSQRQEVPLAKAPGLAESVQSATVSSAPSTQVSPSPRLLTTASTSQVRASTTVRPSHAPEPSAKTPGLHANPYGEPQP